MFRGLGDALTVALGLMVATLGSAMAGEIAAPAGTAPNATTVQVADASLSSATDPAPRWSSRASLSEGSYRAALSRGKLDLGVRFDAPVRAVRPGDAAIDPVVAYVPPLPTLSVGLRSTPAGTVASAGSLIERATGATLGQSPESKVGLEWKPSQSRLFLNRGVGIRLDGDDRVTMRLKKGSLGLYMKTAF